VASRGQDAVFVGFYSPKDEDSDLGVARIGRLARRIPRALGHNRSSCDHFCPNAG
jgi:hypothetical protein